MSPQKQSSTLIYLIMFLGFALGFLYNNQIDASAVVPALSPKFELATLKGLERVSVDYSLLMSDQFTQLKIFGELPVKPQSGGKNNPFQ